MKDFVGGLFCLVVGCALCAAAAFTWLRTRRFVEEAATAFGEVVELRERSGEGTTYAPVVRFPLPSGRVVEFTETVSSNPPAHKVGDRVRVLYRPGDPSDAKVASRVSLYLVTVIFAGIGMVCVVAGLLVAVFAVAG